MLKKLAITLAALGVVSSSALAFAASNDEAVAAAKAEVPANSQIINSYVDDGKYNVHFKDANGDRYEVEVSALTNKVLEVEIDKMVRTEAKTVVITPEQAKEVVLKAYPDAKNVSVFTDRDDHKVEYEVYFSTDKFRGQADVNPETGALGDVELKYY